MICTYHWNHKTSPPPEARGGKTLGLPWASLLPLLAFLYPIHSPPE